MKYSKYLRENLSYQMYRYAPESFKLFINNKPVALSQNERSEFGNLAIRNKKELEKELVRYCRKNLVTTKRVNTQYKLGFRTENENVQLTLQGYYININKLSERLACYKYFKSLLEKDGWKHKTHDTALLDGEYKVKSIQEGYIEVFKKIKYVA